MENLTEKVNIKRKKCNSPKKDFKSCAAFGITDCSCCKDNASELNKKAKKKHLLYKNAAVKPTEKHSNAEASTSHSTSQLHQMATIKENENAVDEDEEINVTEWDDDIDAVCASLQNGNKGDLMTYVDSATCVDAVKVTENESQVGVRTSDCSTSSTSEQNMEEEEIDVVSLPDSEEAPIIESSPKRSIKIRIKRSQITAPPMNTVNAEDEEIDVVNSPVQETENHLNENEIIDVVSLPTDTREILSLPEMNSNESSTRANNLIKKRKRNAKLNALNRISNGRINKPAVLTIDLVKVSRDDSIIEITDTPEKRLFSEVISVDDDDSDDCSNVPVVTKGRLLECPVCLQDLTRKEKMSTICGHVYCSSCIKNAIKTTKKCPNCRKPLTLKSIHPLFI